MEHSDQEQATVATKSSPQQSSSSSSASWSSPLPMRPSPLASKKPLVPHAPYNPFAKSQSTARPATGKRSRVAAFSTTKEGLTRTSDDGLDDFEFDWSTIKWEDRLRMEQFLLEHLLPSEFGYPYFYLNELDGMPWDPDALSSYEEETDQQAEQVTEQESLQGVQQNLEDSDDFEEKDVGVVDGQFN